MKIHPPEEVGMSSERLARLTNYMEQLTKDNQWPGIMTLVQRKGKVVHLGKHGLMDIEAGKPIQEDTIFRIYSMTKPVIAVAVMMLLEEGRVSLNDWVSDYIPSFAKVKVETEAGLVEQDLPVALYHLMTHTSGLGYYGAPFVQRSQTLTEAVDQVIQHPLLFQPGTGWAYSSASDVLGFVIQVAADMPLGDFLEERIFKPLGMVDTAFHVPEEKLDRLAQIYEFEIPGELRIYQDTGLIGDVVKPTKCPSGGAGLVSTLGDYLAFCNCLINNGRYENGYLLSRKTIAWMTANHLPAAFLPTHMGPNMRGYGLGVWATPSLEQARTLTSPGQYGWGGTAKTYFWVDPAEEFIALILMQVMSALGWRLVDDIFPNLAYQAIVA